jgi:hypothetical protein
MGITPIDWDIWGHNYPIGSMYGIFIIIYLHLGHLWGIYVGIHNPAPWILWVWIFSGRKITTKWNCTQKSVFLETPFAGEFTAEKPS